MQQNTQAPKVISVILNQFMGPLGIDLNTLKDHLVKSGSFIDEMDARCAITAMVPSMSVMSQLTERYIVTADIWAKKQAGHPGWEFKCVDRSTADANFRPFAQADMGMGGHSSNRGFMFGLDCFGRQLGTHRPATNLELYQVLGAYTLTQIHPLPPAQFGAYPAGLELLELVKTRLFQSQQSGMQPFNMPANPYGNERYNAFNQAQFPFGPFMGAATNTRMAPLPSVSFEFSNDESFTDTVLGIQEILLKSEVLVETCGEIELLTMVNEISRELQMADYDAPKYPNLFLTIGELQNLPAALAARVGLGFNGWVVHSAYRGDSNDALNDTAPEVVIFRRQMASW